MGELKDGLESKKEEVLVLREKLRSLDYHMQTKNRKIEKLTDQIEAMGSSLDSRDLLMLKKSSKISHRRRRKSSVSINQHLSTNFESSYSDDHLIPTLIVNVPSEEKSAKGSKKILSTKQSSEQQKRIHLEDIIKDQEKKIIEMESMFKKDKGILYAEAKNVEDLVENFKREIGNALLITKFSNEGKETHKIKISNAHSEEDLLTEVKNKSKRIANGFEVLSEVIEK